MRTIFLSIAATLMALSWLGVRAQVSFNLPANSALANVNKAEYFFDTDPGAGAGTSMSLTAGVNIMNSNFSVPISSLSNGLHRLYVRVANTNGLWSLTSTQPLFIVNPLSFPTNPGLFNVTGMEYFFDADPGPGLGTAIPVTAGQNVTVSNYAIPVSGLSNGIHRLYLRAKDAAGVWSLTTEQPLFIVAPVNFPGNVALVNVTAAEGFFDTDPGFGKGIPIPVSTPGTNTVANGAVSLNGLSTGLHRFYQRVQNTNGRWSMTNEQNLAILASSLVIPSNPTPGNMTLLEYFFDTDPGPGKGTPVAIPASTNLANYTFTADVSTLAEGTHYLYVRVLDDWSLSSVLSFNLGTPLAVKLLSFTGRLQSDNSILLSWQTTDEVNNSYFAIERSGDGAHFSSIGEVPGNHTTTLQHDYSFTDAHPLDGLNYYRLRQVDLDSTATYSPLVSVRLQLSGGLHLFPNPVHEVLSIGLGEGIASGNGVFRVVDQAGRVVLMVQASLDALQQVNVSALAAGTYLLVYITDKGTYSGKFVKY